MEIQKVEEIFDNQAADSFGLFKNQIVVMIHTGSRGLGHQVCTDYLKIMIPAMRRHQIKVPDREFACRKKLDDRSGQADIVIQMGHVHYLRGKTAQAKRCYDRAHALGDGT